MRPVRSSSCRHSIDGSLSGIWHGARSMWRRWVAQVMQWLSGGDYRKGGLCTTSKSNCLRFGECGVCRADFCRGLGCSEAVRTARLLRHLSGQMGGRSRRSWRWSWNRGITMTANELQLKLPWALHTHIPISPPFLYHCLYLWQWLSL